jgi:large subunit ribosomal protein L43
MSINNLFLKSGYVAAPLANGVGRFVLQCQRMTIKFCKSHGGSRGVRDFIENDLVAFARDNPGVVMYLKPRRHRSPVVVAEYCKLSCGGWIGSGTLDILEEF